MIKTGTICRTNKSCLIRENYVNSKTETRIPKNKICLVFSTLIDEVYDEHWALVLADNVVGYVRTYLLDEVF